MSGGPQRAYLVAVNALGTTKPISDSLTQLLLVNPSKGRYQAARILERFGSKAWGLSRIFIATPWPHPFNQDATGCTQIHPLAN